MILDTLLEFAKNNQLLAAGMGTVGFGSVVYFIRSLPGRVLNTVNGLCTIDLSLEDHSALYHELMGVLSQCRVGAFRNFTTDHDGELVAGYGSALGSFRGRLLTFSRSRVEEKGQGRQRERLNLRLFSRDVALLEDLLNEARHPSDQNKIKIYTGSGWWGPPVRKKKRSLDTIFTDGTIKQGLVAKLEWFFANEAWYEQRGIPYKLVFLLHGPPGTGKTSLIYGVASHFNRSLCTVKSVSGVDNLLRDAPEHAFIAIEDIDMLTMARPEDGTDQKDGADAPAPSAIVQTEYGGESGLQVLINALDGIATPHGIVVFITTNHRDRLDHALIRKGRIDHEVEVGPLGAGAAAAMFKAFYGCEPTEEIGQLTGADLQAICLEQPDPARAIAAILAGNEHERENNKPLISLVNG